MTKEIDWISIDKAERVFHVTTTALQELIDNGQIRHLKKGGSDGFYTFVDRAQVAGLYAKRVVKEKYAMQTPSAALGGIFGALLTEVSEITKVLRDTASEAAEGLSNADSIDQLANEKTKGDAGKVKTCTIEGLGAFRQSIGLSLNQMSIRFGLATSTYSRAEQGKPVSYATAQVIVRGAKQIRKETGKSGEVPKIVSDS